MLCLIWGLLVKTSKAFLNAVPNLRPNLQGSNPSTWQIGRDFWIDPPKDPRSTCRPSKSRAPPVLLETFPWPVHGFLDLEYWGYGFRKSTQSLTWNPKSLSVCDMSSEDSLGKGWPKRVDTCRHQLAAAWKPMLPQGRLLGQYCRDGPAVGCAKVQSGYMSVEVPRLWWNQSHLPKLPYDGWMARREGTLAGA